MGVNVSSAIDGIEEGREGVALRFIGAVYFCFTLLITYFVSLTVSVFCIVICFRSVLLCGK